MVSTLMAIATFRFFEELNDFLAPPRRKIAFTHEFTRRASVKDMIEALGVPHTEIDLILVNGESVDFSYTVCADDYISVYPMFESFDIAALTRLRPAPLRDPRFILDTHLGKLAKYVRLLGFDTLYDNSSDDEQLAATAADERRILLTRDVGLLKRGCVSHGYFVRAIAPRRQLEEILERFDLRGLARPYTRCVRCNVMLLEVSKGDLGDAVATGVRARFEHFRLCPGCDRIFWQGSHYAHMQADIEELLARP